MAPRPTPDGGLFPEEKPYHQGRRRSSLTEAASDSWDDELGGSSIELSCCGIDPLLGSLPQNCDEDAACLHDGEIAALMAAEWEKEDAVRRRRAVAPKQEPLSAQQKCAGFACVFVVALALMGLGVFAVVFGMGDGSAHHAADFQCPTGDRPLGLPSLQQLVQEQLAGNNTSVCRKDLEVECTCQNPTNNPLASDAQLLDEQLAKETELLQGRDNLDVLFVGQFADILEDDALWESYQFDKAHIANEKDISSSSLLYRLNKQGVIPDEVQPKLWWISLGEKDLVVDGCSLDAVHTGTYHLVQQILGRSSMDVKIVLSPPPRRTEDAALLLEDWNDRLKCIAARNSQVSVYDPYAVVDEQADDDDFFMDVSSSTSSSTTSEASAEEVQQAVIHKLEELLLL